MRSDSKHIDKYQADLIKLNIFEQEIERRQATEQNEWVANSLNYNANAQSGSRMVCDRPYHQQLVNRRRGADWIVTFNPRSRKSLNIDNIHTLDHTGVISCIAFSSDGKYLATGSNHTIQIWNVATGNKELTFNDQPADDGSEMYIRAVCFSSDGKYLISGAEDERIHIWDIQARIVRHTLSGYGQGIFSLALSPSGSMVLSGSGDHKVRLWDIESGKEVCKFVIEGVVAKDACVMSVAFSPNGKLIAAALLDNTIRLWDVKTRTLLQRIDVHTNSIYSLAFSPDGQSLLSGSLDNTLRIWDLGRYGSNGRLADIVACHSTLVGHKDFVLTAAYSPNGNWILSSSKDCGVQFWDPHTSQSQCLLQGHRNAVVSVAFSPTQRYFATGSGDSRARIWSY
ncbi:general transcription repressor [Coemansia sp. RSA 1358]|nr:general transcription repressor [Coemansia sp. RSA 1358]